MKVDINTNTESKLTGKTAMTIGGVEVDPTDIVALSLVEHYTNGDRYFVKMNRHGNLFKHINDGNGMLEIHKRDKKLGVNVWEFKKVNKQVFDLYAAYLRTKNTATCLQAERLKQTSN